MSELTKDAVPRIWFVAKRVLRTITQALIVYVPLVNIAALIVSEHLTSQEGVTVPAWVFAVLNGIVVATALLMGLVARLMANPRINAWLVRFGLGSVPLSAVREGKV